MIDFYSNRLFMISPFMVPELVLVRVMSLAVAAGQIPSPIAAAASVIDFYVEEVRNSPRSRRHAMPFDPLAIIRQ
jgi:hypothetical protein